MAIQWDDEIQWDDDEEVGNKLSPEHLEMGRKFIEDTQGEPEWKSLLREAAMGVGVGGGAVAGSALAGPPGGVGGAMIGGSGAKLAADYALGPKPQTAEEYIETNYPRQKSVPSPMQGLGKNILNSGRPASVAKTIEGVATFPVEIAEMIGEDGVIQTGKNVAKGLAETPMVSGPVEMLQGKYDLPKTSQMLADTNLFDTLLGGEVIRVPVAGGLGKMKAKYDARPMKIIEETARKFAPEPPSKVQSAQARKTKNANDFDALAEVSGFRNEIHLPGNESRGKLPKNKEQLSSALDQLVDKKLEYVDTIAASAGEGGVRIKLDDPIASLEAILISPRTPSWWQGTAKTLLKDFKAKNERGGLSPSDAVALMRAFNNRITQVYTGKNISGEGIELYNFAANDLRNSLNTAMDKIPGAEFKVQRQKLGKLLDMQKRAFRNMEREATLKSKGRMDLFKLIAAEQGLHAVLKMSPELAASAGGSWAMSVGHKWWRGSDRAIKKAMSVVDKATNGKLLNLEVPPIPPMAPTVKDTSTGMNMPANYMQGKRGPTPQSMTIVRGGYVKRIPKEARGAGNMQPGGAGTQFSPQVGANTASVPGLGQRNPMRPPQPNPPMRFDNTVGARMPVAPQSGARNPMGEANPQSPKLILDPSTGKMVDANYFNLMNKYK